MTELLTREQLQKMFGPKEITQDQYDAMSELQREQHEVFAELLLDLRWPRSREGDVADVSYVAALVAYHLVRCGWRPDPDKRVIKPRKPIGRGVATGAVEWVGVDEPDDPLANIENMTMREIANLEPSQRTEAIRRLAPGSQPDIPMPESPWQMKPNIRISDVSQTPFAE